MSPFAELWGMLCPDCGPDDHTAIAQAAVEALKRRCVYEAADNGKSIRIEAPTVEELERIRDQPTKLHAREPWPDEPCVRIPGVR